MRICCSANHFSISENKSTAAFPPLPNSARVSKVNFRTKESQFEQSYEPLLGNNQQTPCSQDVIPRGSRSIPFCPLTCLLRFRALLDGGFTVSSGNVSSKYTDN
ncbi:hypothetical protein AVEN_175668-1 [Araneus ventricosus]|uniref:Uncharacterized protein n=1 Tax=Araneus ventricosus TaxID=182803 RepID=A0A4Y2Q2R0_ARAVE|nr:hypothetical protein AVEN_175668-1 [Araneus ventricosus]